MQRLSRFLIAATLASLVSACGASLRNPQVAAVRQNPERYQGHDINIRGTVTSSWGIPLVPFHLYKVDDGTGEITVISQSHTPPTGARVNVKGQVDNVASLGGQSIGLHLKEEKLDVKR